jgi:uncharacterized membrane protein YjgN (DUF898 family)
MADGDLARDTAETAMGSSGGSLSGANRPLGRTRDRSRLDMRSRAEDDREIDPGPVVDALLVEYQNIHKRVLDQLNAYETTNTRILALIGVLLYFGLTNFNNTADFYTSAVVNLVFIVVIPFVATASVAFTAANLCKIMIWGDFLKIVENKVNRVLGKEARLYGFERAQVMSWEYWRVQYGYAGKSSFLPAVTFSGFLVVAFIVSSAVSVGLRLRFIAQRCADQYPLYCGLAVFMAVVFLGVSAASSFLVSKQRVKSMNDVYDDDRV